jgi:4-hydroxy-3-methylbut-2-enyl diphosphate reductase
MSALLVCSPLRLEARAVRRGLPGAARGSVRVTGYGPARSRRQAQALAAADFGALAIAGVGGGLTDDLAPGDLVVGTEVSDGQHTTRCAAAPLLAGNCAGPGRPRRPGRGHRGPAWPWGPRRGWRGWRGALAVDLESAPLARPRDRPVAVLRAVSGHPGTAAAAPRDRDRRAGGAALCARPARCWPMAAAAGPRQRAAGRAAVVLRGGGAGHRDRREGARPAQGPGLRTQADQCTTPTSWPTWNGAGRCSSTSFRSP